MKSKILDIVGTILLVIGFFFAFLPHATHIAAGLDNEASHTEHIATGITLIVIALIILVYNNDALNKEFFKKFILKKY